MTIFHIAKAPRLICVQTTAQQNDIMTLTIIPSGVRIWGTMLRSKDFVKY